MNTFDNSLFEDIKTVRERDDDMEDALERLANSIHFTRVSIFYGTLWERICERAQARERGLMLGGKKKWAELLMPELFLAICEVPNIEWAAMWDADMHSQPERREQSVLYIYLRNIVSGGIERFLLDGNTLYQDEAHGEESWPTEENDPSEPDLDFFEAPGDVEDDALGSIMAAQIRETLTDDEYNILMADYGDNAELAEELGISEVALRKRQQRLRERLQEKFNGS